MNNTKSSNNVELKKEINQLATDVSNKILSYKKNKKFYNVFLKNINDILAPMLDSKQLSIIEKELIDEYNSKLKLNHKKTSTKSKTKINMKVEDIDDSFEDFDDYN